MKKMFSKESPYAIREVQQQLTHVMQNFLLDDIKQYMSENPQSPFAKDILTGRLALHDFLEVHKDYSWRCKVYADPSSVTLIINEYLRVHPHSVSVFDEEGMLPLHIASRNFNDELILASVLAPFPIGTIIDEPCTGVLRSIAMYSLRLCNKQRRPGSVACHLHHHMG